MIRRWLPSGLTLLLSLSTSLLSAQNLVGYWQNWGGGDYVPIENVDSRYKVINLAFAVPASGTDYNMTFVPCCGETIASLKTKIDNLQAIGHTVNLSIGGGGISIVLSNTTERDVFVSTITQLLIDLDLDGIDIDIESSLTVSSNTTIANPTDPNIVYMIQAIEQIGANFFNQFGHKMFLGFAPETANAEGGQSAWGGVWGSYLPLLHHFRNDIDLVYVQLYNSGSMWGLDNHVYQVGTRDFIVSQVECMIQGFNVDKWNNQAGHFDGFPASKIAVGLPACPSAAGSGFMHVDSVKAAIQYLMGTGPKPSYYTRIGGPYADLGGMMTWSVNWDASSSCNTSSYQFAGNYEQIFQTGSCEQPALGGDVSACDISFPYTLESNTTPAPGVTYTWMNLTSNTVIVSNSTTASSISVNAPAAYRVILSEGVCIRTDDIVIEAEIPSPDLVGSTTLCSGAPLTLSLNNGAQFPSGAQWQWYKDQQAISGATSTTLSTVVEDGLYELEATYGACLETGAHTVSSNLPTAVDDCVGPGEAAHLSIQNTGAGPYHWFDAPTAGAQVATGTAYTTPPLNTTTSYFVEDLGQITTTYTGPPLTNNGLGTLQNYHLPDQLIFNVNQTFTLKEVTVRPLIWGYSHPFNFEIRNSAGTVLANGYQNFSITHPGPFGSLMGPTTLTLTGGGVLIPAGTGYKIVMTSAVGCDHWSGTTYPIAYNPYLTFTGSDVAGKCLAFHDWKVQTAGCDFRVEVVGEVDPICALVAPLSLVQFDVKALDHALLLNWQTEVYEPGARFSIERKTQWEREFVPIGEIQAGIDQVYQFIDRAVMPNIEYAYRLRYIDPEGEGSLSPVRLGKLSSPGGKMSIHPNPVLDRAILEWFDNEPVTITLVGIDGVIIRTWSAVGPSIEIDMADLPEGVYHLQGINAEGRTASVKLLKVSRQ